MARRNRRKKPRAARRAHTRRRLGAWLRSVAKVLGLALLGVGLGSGGYLLYDFLSSSPALSLRRIEIRGLVHTSAEQVRQVAGLEEGMNIFSVEPADCARRIKRLPWVKTVTVQRLVPDRVVVEVREYRPAALLAAGELYLVDEQGQVFKRAHWWDGVDLPVVTGISAEWLQQQGEAVAMVLRQGLQLLAQLRQLPCLRRRTIGQIHLDELLGPTIVIDPGSLVVSMGPQASQRPVLLCQALEQLKLRKLRARALLINRTLRGWQATINSGARGEVKL